MAAVQLTSTLDRERNRATAERLVRDAARQGAQLIVLPEKWTVLGPSDAVAAAAEPFDGPTLAWAGSIARELKIDLIAGSFAESAAPKNANTSIHVGPDGELKQTYRKLHLFDVEVGGTSYRESEHEQPGDALALTAVAGAQVGMTICYDLRFPELYRTLAVRGAEVLVVPAAFTLATTREHWEVLLRARAIENQCAVIAANQVGRHSARMESGGRSMIVDAWGVVLAQAPDAECAIVADIDLDAQAAIRAKVPSLASRREDVFDFGGAVH